MQHYNPVYTQGVACIRTLTTKCKFQKTRRNFKLLEWRTGSSVGSRTSLPLIEGDYILFDGRIRLDGKIDDVDWGLLTWNPNKERVEYDGASFENAHVIGTNTSKSRAGAEI